MGVKEGNLLHDRKEQKLQNYRVKFRQNFEILSASPFPKFVAEHEKGWSENEGIDENSLNQIFELLRIHGFICTRLDFVFAQEFRRWSHVKVGINGPHRPENGIGHDQRAPNF